MLSRSSARSFAERRLGDLGVAPVGGDGALFGVAHQVDVFGKRCFEASVGFLDQVGELAEVVGLLGHRERLVVRRRALLLRDSQELVDLRPELFGGHRQAALLWLTLLEVALDDVETEQLEEGDPVLVLTQVRRAAAREVGRPE